MDFARKQLEKYGWSDGKGLGKHENGIAEALKPKIKRSVTGIGHDPAADFTEHWWSTLYDKAAKNVEVKEKNGKTKKIKTKDSDFQITNSTYHLKKKSKKSKADVENGEVEYSEFFIKTAVLDGVKTEAVAKCDSEHEDTTREEKKDVFKMSDEELFAACEGRTAHKGARHGIRATGKLTRIERQEQLLLTQPQYNGYSHSMKICKKHTEYIENPITNNENTNEIKKKKKKGSKHVVEEGSLENMSIDKEDMAAQTVKDNSDAINNAVSNTEEVKKKKKKRKHCFSYETVDEDSLNKS